MSDSWWAFHYAPAKPPFRGGTLVMTAFAAVSLLFVGSKTTGRVIIVFRIWRAELWIAFSLYGPRVQFSAHSTGTSAPSAKE